MLHSSLTLVAMPIVKVTQLRVQCQDDKVNLEEGVVFYVVIITQFTWKYRGKLNPLGERVTLASGMPQVCLYIQDR